MGCAGSNSKKDIYEKLLQKNGQDETEEFVVEQCQAQFLEQNRYEIVRAIQTKISSHQADVLKQIDLAKLEIDKSYQKSLSRLQKENSKALKKAEKMYPTSIDDLMGYKDMCLRIQNFKEEKTHLLRTEEELIKRELDNRIEKLFKELQKEAVDFKGFEKLSDQKQEKFMKVAKEQHKQAIKRGLDDMSNQIEKSCNYHNFYQRIDDILKREELLSMVKQAELIFAKGQQKVKGASGCTTC